MPLDKFRFFLEQDDFYLEEYSRCLALGAAKSRNERELRYFTVDLNQVLDAEIPNNRELLARVIELGAEDRGGSLTMAPANVAYASYLQALALRGGPLDISGGAPVLLVELRRDRDRPAGTGGRHASDLRRLDRLLLEAGGRSDGRRDAPRFRRADDPRSDERSSLA